MASLALKMEERALTRAPRNWNTQGNSLCQRASRCSPPGTLLACRDHVGLLTSRTVRKSLVLFQPPRLCHLLMAAIENKHGVKPAPLVENHGSRAKDLTLGLRVSGDKAKAALAPGPTLGCFLSMGSRGPGRGMGPVGLMLPDSPQSRRLSTCPAMGPSTLFHCVPCDPVSQE